MSQEINLGKKLTNNLEIKNIRDFYCPNRPIINLQLFIRSDYFFLYQGNKSDVTMQITFCSLNISIKKKFIEITETLLLFEDTNEKQKNWRILRKNR